MSQKQTTYVRRELSPVEGVHLTQESLPADLASAYASMRKVIENEDDFGAAWKLGGTTAATQKIFNVHKLYFGVLHQKELAVQPDVAPSFPTYELKGEAEIALRLAPSVDALLDQGADAVRSAPLEALFDGWCVALELPSSPVVNLVEMGVVALVADRCAAGYLALGPCRDLAEMTSWDSTQIRVEQNSQQITEGSASNLLSSADDCARSFLLEALEQGFRPRAGQWVSTGGATPCVPFEQGARIDVYYGQSQELSFTAGT
ncbi:hypothetical protein [uncultured Roseibium sp.]|uniref:hypothetical protein n=1 Tax=uncultured Roseibium sp. TaxID=1936171 RepID=UPI00261C6B40|nr:hypothetical protein [uncultured Roseibium sp.]